MPICYRKMKVTDLEAFLDLRIAQLKEEGAKSSADIRPALKEYCIRHMADDTYVAYLAMDGDSIVGTGAMSIIERPPHFACPNGKVGILSSMYTIKPYRRRGIAKAILALVVEEARAHGCSEVQITATDMGMLLYADFGFVQNTNYMCYRF